MESLLVYTSIGKDPNYLKCLEYFCKSLVYTNPCVLNLLVICDASFSGRVRELVRPYAYVNLHVLEAPDALTSVQASMHKLRIFDFPQIFHYRVTLFVDLDCLFLGDLTFLFKKRIEDNKLYVYAERDRVVDNQLKWFSLSNETDKSLCFYTQRHMEFMERRGKLPFNAGLFLFRVSPLMKRHFEGLNTMVRTFKGEYFYEQSFMNTYFHLTDLSDYSIFDRTNVQMISNTVQNDPSHRIIHFNGVAGDGATKVDRMRAFWMDYLSKHPPRYEEFPTRNDMIRALVPQGATILEIGVFRGEFAEHLHARNPKQLYLVDMWSDDPVGSGDADGNNFVRLESGAQALAEVTERFQYQPNVSVCQMKSGEFLPLLADASIDVAYIDGDHSYAGVMQDLEGVYPKMRRGGWIMGHDYEMNMTKARTAYEFGVKRAVDEFCAKYNLKVCAKGMDGCVSYAIYIPV